MILGELEQKVMDIIWESSEVMKPRDVLDALVKDNGDEYAYTTIMTVMSNLHRKEILSREKKGITYFYKAQKLRKQVINNKLEQIFNEMFASHKELAIAKFVDTLKVSKEDIKFLENYLNSDEE